MLNGLIESRKKLVAWNESVIKGSTTAFDNRVARLGMFVVATWARVPLQTLVFLIELPVHVSSYPTKSFELLARRDFRQSFLDSYTDHLRRYRLSVATTLALLLLAIGQVFIFGWSIYRVTKPTPVTALASSIDINPTWDDSIYADHLWNEFNPCSIAFSDYLTQGPTATIMTFGKNIADPTDCDLIFDYHTQHNRPAMKFSLASVPNNATITAVNLLVNVSNTSNQIMRIVRPTSDSIDTLSPFDAYEAIGNGTLYASPTWSTSGAKNVTLSGTVVSDVQSRITGSDVIAIAIKGDENPADNNNGAIDSVNHGTSGNRPILRISYTVPPTPPSDFGHSANTTSSITWSWTDSSTSDTSNRVHDAGHSIVCTTAGDGNTVDATVECAEGGLSANTQYTRHANVLDAHGNSDSASASAFTSIQTPTGVSSSALTPTSITVTASGTISNIGVGQSALWFEETVTNTNSGWITTNSWQKTGLNPNSTYTFRVKARNGDGDETAFTATTDLPTLAAAPDLAPGRAVSTWYTTNPFTFTNNAAWGSGGVQYYGYAWNTSSSYTFTGGESTWSDAHAKCPGGTCTVANTTLSQAAAADGNNWYLHVLAYDYTETGSGGEVSYGPFWFDATAPGPPATVNDGTGADISAQTSTTELSANWTASTDAASGLQKYQYAIGSTPAGTDVVAYTDNGTATSVTASGLTLSVGSTYYVSVRAIDVAGNTGTAQTSNGVVIQAAAAPPPEPEPQPSPTPNPVTTPTITSPASGGQMIGPFPTIRGTAPANAAVFLVVDRVINTVFLSSGSGSFTIQLRTPVTPGPHSIFARARLSDGSVSDESVPIQFTVIAPGIPVTVLERVVQNGTSPAVTFKAVAPTHSTVEIYLDHTKVDSFKAAPSTTPAFGFIRTVTAPATASPGQHTIHFVAVNANGVPSVATGHTTFTKTDGTVSAPVHVTYTQPVKYVVKAGDSLWRLAETFLGDGSRWGEIRDANLAEFPSLTNQPSTIYVGWTLTIPAP